MNNLIETKEVQAAWAVLEKRLKELSFRQRKIDRFETRISKLRLLLEKEEDKLKEDVRAEADALKLAFDRQDNTLGPWIHKFKSKELYHY